MGQPWSGRTVGTVFHTVCSRSWRRRRRGAGSCHRLKVRPGSDAALAFLVRDRHHYRHHGWPEPGRTGRPAAEAGRHGVVARRRCCWPSGSCQDLFRLAPNTWPWGRAGPVMRGLGMPAADVVAVQPWPALAALGSFAPPLAARSSVRGTAAGLGSSAFRSCQQGRCPCVHRRLGFQPAGLLASSC
ncbi:hypothetical protein D3C84_885410 [compost metagenome]